MGLFSFAATAGEKLSGAFYEFLHTGSDPADLNTLPPERKDELRKLRIEHDIKELGTEARAEVQVERHKVTVTGEAPDQETFEKIALIAGNQEGISEVDCQLRVSRPEPQSTLHTVQEGESLEQIAKRYYGSEKQAETLLAANQPMIRRPEKIYPGQVLRVPRPH